MFDDIQHNLNNLQNSINNDPNLTTEQRATLTDLVTELINDISSILNEETPHQPPMRNPLKDIDAPERTHPTFPLHGAAEIDPKWEKLKKLPPIED